MIALDQIETKHRIDKGHQHRTQVVADAREVLSQSPLFRGRMNLINVEEQDGNLVLEGRLPSFYLKQMLQTEARKPAFEHQVSLMFIDIDEVHPAAEQRTLRQHFAGVGDDLIGVLVGLVNSVLRLNLVQCDHG